jgi:F-type H+-transporting ATPase subunit b
MLIDWFTVGAQVLNFLLLVWLLKRYLYQPILDAISAREQRIELQLADAAAKQAAAIKERDEFNRKNAQFDSERAALFGKLTEEVKAEHQRLLEEARKDVDGLRSRLQDALRTEQQALGGEIARGTCEQVFAIARQALADLASTSLEESMARTFIERLRALGDAERKLLTAAVASAPGAVMVRSAFDLPALQRSGIEQAIAEICGAPTQLSYETVPGLVAGVELSANGRKLAWSVADYLAALQKSAGEILQPESAAVPGAS